jgi:hypothetical protein
MSVDITLAVVSPAEEKAVGVPLEQQGLQLQGTGQQHWVGGK